MKFSTTLGLTLIAASLVATNILASTETSKLTAIEPRTPTMLISTDFPSAPNPTAETTPLLVEPIVVPRTMPVVALPPPQNTFINEALANPIHGIAITAFGIR